MERCVSADFYSEVNKTSRDLTPDDKQYHFSLLEQECWLVYQLSPDKVHRLLCKAI